MFEEELKNKIAERYFKEFDTTRIIGKIDFCVAQRMPEDAALFGLEIHSLLWAEAKQGSRHDIYDSFVQLVLTIGKARTHRSFIPPRWLGAFDEEKIAFVPFEAVGEVLEQNDFNWNVAPSDHSTKEFLQLRGIVESALVGGARIFRYAEDDAVLREFIEANIGTGEMLRIEVDKNNFMSVFDMWNKAVMPTIQVDWEEYKKKLMIISADFFLSALMSVEDRTVTDNLRVKLDGDKYRVRYDVEMNGVSMSLEQTVNFSDGRKAHRQFWNIFERPPKEEYKGYILARRDMLVPQDVRERKGAFFTPQKWVRLSQQYLAKTLGKDWQDEYYIWDCCAGTGNLLVGLTNKYRIFASTLDLADVDIMRERAARGANLLKANIFQFDFLNDSFDKCPEELREIIRDPEKRKKLVIYINPPYAEAGNAKQKSGTGSNKTGVSNDTAMAIRHRHLLGMGVRELFAQFFVRIYDEINGCVLGSFSTVKHLQGSAFKAFRGYFKARLMSGFVVPADTFDNVSGEFPIGFLLWNTGDTSKAFTSKSLAVYDARGAKCGQKVFYANDRTRRITEWVAKNIKRCDNVNPLIIGYTGNNGPDFQNNIYLSIESRQKSTANGSLSNMTKYGIFGCNLLVYSIYFAVRMCIPATWLNDRDQFLYPNEKWMEDKDFHNDCLAFTLFHTQNRITIESGANHWIPFAEQEVEPKKAFKSHFMTDYIKGSVCRWSDYGDDVFENQKVKPSRKVLKFGKEARAVFDAGRELWRYYHSKEGANPDASFYDIRKYFQGVNEKGKMNNESADGRYMELVGVLRERMRELGRRIEERVWEYGFLR